MTQTHFIDMNEGFVMHGVVLTLGGFFYMALFMRLVWHICCIPYQGLDERTLLFFFYYFTFL